MTEEVKAEVAESLTIELDAVLVEKIKKVFGKEYTEGDDINVQDIVNQLIDKYLDIAPAVDSLIKFMTCMDESQSTLSDNVQIIEKVTRQFENSFGPVVEVPEAPARSIIDVVPKAKVFKRTLNDGTVVQPETTSAVGDQIHATRNARVVHENKGINPSPKPGEVRIGMGTQRRAPANATKVTPAAPDLANAKTPAVPIKNDLLDKAPTDTVKEMLKQMKSKSGTTMSHPSGCIGPDMPKQVQIMPNGGGSALI